MCFSSPFPQHLAAGVSEQPLPCPSWAPLPSGAREVKTRSSAGASCTSFRICSIVGGAGRVGNTMRFLAFEPIPGGERTERYEDVHLLAFVGSYHPANSYTLALPRPFSVRLHLCLSFLDETAATVLNLSSRRHKLLVLLPVGARPRPPGPEANFRPPLSLVRGLS